MAHQPATSFEAGLGARARTTRPQELALKGTGRESARHMKPGGVLFLPREDSCPVKRLLPGKNLRRLRRAPPGSVQSPRRSAAERIDTRPRGGVNRPVKKFPENLAENCQVRMIRPYVRSSGPSQARMIRPRERILH